MKRTDMIPGICYAMGRGRGEPAPAVVLETGRLWQLRHVRESDGVHRPQYSVARAKTPAGDAGFLAIASHAPGQAELLTEIDLPDELTPDTVAELGARLPEGVTLRVVNNRWLAGPWETVHAAYKEQAAADQAQYDRERQAVKEQAELWAVVARRLAVLGVEGATHRRGAVTLPLTAMVELLNREHLNNRHQGDATGNATR